MSLYLFLALVVVGIVVWNIVLATRTANRCHYLVVGVLLVDGQQGIVHSVSECFGNRVVRVANMDRLAVEVVR